MYGIIYKATNTANGKVYIGQTIRTLQERISQHIYDAKTCQFYFHRALRKYGESAFTWEQIDFADTQEELDQKEIFWIDFYKSFIDPTKGYNSDSGGKNGRPSEETKKRISEKLKGRKKNITPEGLKRKQEVAARRVWTQASKDKLSKSHTGKTYSEERKQQISQALKGKAKESTKYQEMWTEERRQERSESYSGEHNPNFGKHLSEEAKKAISEKAKARGPRVQTEEEKKKRAESIRAWHARRRQLLLEQTTN